MDTEKLLALARVMAHVQMEVITASKKHAPMMSAHHAYGVILEELDEFWAEVKRREDVRSPEQMRAELIQIAAMAARAIVDLQLPAPDDIPF